MAISSIQTADITPADSVLSSSNTKKLQKKSTIPTFSIVIPTLNEELFLPQLLEDLAAQTLLTIPGLLLEIIVVDAQSEDQTAAIVKQFQTHFLKQNQSASSMIELKLITPKSRGVSLQRNLGGKAARADWIIFMDADNRLPNHFLDGIRYQLARTPQTDIFTTLIKTEVEENIDYAIERVINLSLELYLGVNKPQGFGALIGCRRSLFEQIQFDEATQYLEDSLFIQTTVDAGYTYQIFRNPRYFYSLRRLKKEGTLKMLQKGATIQIEFLTGKKQFVDDRYPMLGGSYYEQERTTTFMKLHSLQQYFKAASQKQLNQAQKILKSIMSLED